MLVVVRITLSSDSGSSGGWWRAVGITPDFGYGGMYHVCYVCYVRMVIFLPFKSDLYDTG